MLLRGKTWQFKIRIPQDIQKYYAGKSSKFIEESLKTSETKDARRLRDQKLRKYQSLWTEMRIREHRRPQENGRAALEATSSDSLLIDLRNDEIGAENLISAYGDEIDRMAMRVASSGSHEDFEEAREEVIGSGRGQHLWREIQITRGDMTPLAPLCWEWLETKRGKAAKTRTEYSRAIRLLLEKFEYLEQVEHRKVRSFLDDLLQINAKATVQKYTTAYKGIWEHQGWHEGIAMWSVRRMDSAVREVEVKAINDDAYLKIMNAINGTGKRRLWLAAKIAAYSGASRSGVCGLRLEPTAA